MRVLICFVLLLGVVAADRACSWSDGTQGTCVDINTTPQCQLGSRHQRNLCPGPANIRCCSNQYAKSWSERASDTISHYKNKIVNGWNNLFNTDDQNDGQDDSNGGRTPTNGERTSAGSCSIRASTPTCPSARRMTQVCYEMGGGAKGPGRGDGRSCPNGSRGITRKNGISWVCAQEGGNSLKENQPTGPMQRSAILGRGVTWVNERIRYSQLRRHKGYRTDCSGFVSMSWHLSQAPSTGTFAGATSAFHERVKCADMLPGDAMVTEGRGHIVLFVGFSNAEKTRAVIWEEMGHNYGTMEVEWEFNGSQSSKDSVQQVRRAGGNRWQRYRCIRRKSVSASC